MTRKNYLQFGLILLVSLAVFLLNPVKVQADCVGVVKCLYESEPPAYACQPDFGYYTKAGCGYAGNPPACGVKIDCHNPNCNVGNTCQEGGGGTPTPTPTPGCSGTTDCGTQTCDNCTQVCCPTGCKPIAEGCGGEPPGPTPPPGPGVCSGISYYLSDSTPDPNTTITVDINRTSATSCDGGWGYVGLLLDGNPQGLALCYADGSNCLTGYHSSVNSDGSGNHTLQFTVNNSSCLCNTTSFITTSPPQSTCSITSIDPGSVVSGTGGVTQVTYSGTVSSGAPAQDVRLWLERRDGLQVPCGLSPLLSEGLYGGIYYYQVSGCSASNSQYVIARAFFPKQSPVLAGRLLRSSQ